MLRPDMTYAEIEAWTLKDDGVLEEFERIEMQCMIYDVEMDKLTHSIRDIQSEQADIRKAKDKYKKVMNTSKKIRHELMLKEMKGQ